MIICIMTEQNNTKKQKDKWDKFDIISKAILAILVPASITFYGLYSEWKRSHESEENRRSQVLIQTLSNRESSGADMKAKMFATLMEHYFKGQDEKSKVLILELIALNFQDQFQLRPLFERLDAVLANPEEKKELRRVVKNIVSREIRRIVGSGGDVCKIELEKNKLSQAVCAPISLTLLDVQEDHISVSATPERTDVFEINYFDMPFTDNNRKGELTYSLVLSETNKKDGRAKVKLVLFPRHYYSEENRLKLDQMMGKYLEQGIHNY